MHRDENCAFLERVVDDVIREIGDRTVWRHHPVWRTDLGGYSVVVMIKDEMKPLSSVPSDYLNDPSMRGKPLREFIEREIRVALGQRPPFRRPPSANNTQ